MTLPPPPPPAPTPRSRRAVVALGFPAVAAAAGAAVLALGLVAVGAVLVVIGIGVVAGNLLLATPSRLLGAIGGIEVGAEDEARLVNVVEGLCVANGLTVPHLRVLDDPAPNALIIGARPDAATLILTTGLLDGLDRIELEGVVAHELAHLKRKDVIDQARAACALGLVAQLFPHTTTWTLLLAHPTRETLADMVGTEMTRYPPGLVAGLQKIAEAPVSRPRLTKRTARLTGAFWCAPFSDVPDRRVRAGVLDLELRIAALAEL